MNKLCILLVLAIVANEVVGMNLRIKRQDQQPDDDNQLDDRYGWEQRQQWWPNRPNRPSRPTRPIGPTRPGQVTTPSPNGSTTTTQSSSVADCMRTCPVTSEYNPVCGSDSVTYSNPGRLQCAQNCGVNVNLLRSSPCPTSTTTAAPSS